MKLNLGFQCEVVEGEVKRIGRHICHPETGKVMGVIFDEELALQLTARPKTFVVMNGREIRDLAECAGFTITDFPEDPYNEYAYDVEHVVIDCAPGGVRNDAGDIEHYRYVAMLEEYPEEGVNPLGEKL